jgi:hypothetical protein
MMFFSSLQGTERSLKIPREEEGGREDSLPLNASISVLKSPLGLKRELCSKTEGAGPIAAGDESIG